MITSGTRRWAAAGALTIALLLAGVPAAGAPSSATRRSPAAQVVAEESAANRAVARHDAHRRLRLFDALPGAVPYCDRPSGIGKKLSGQGPFPGDSRQVHYFRFLTVPRPPHEIYAWLHRHPPRGSAAWESEGEFIYWEHGPPGTRGATAVVRAVPRVCGGSVVRIDIYESWELPRSPAAKIPPGSRYVSVRIVPSGGFIVGEKPRPTRRTGTADRRLIESFAQVVDHAPAFQLYRPPSCGPQPPPGHSNRFEFTFKTGRHGKTLARVSQEAPIGICDALLLNTGSRRRSFALEDGWTLLHLARDLIRQARPRPHGAH